MADQPHRTYRLGIDQIKKFLPHRYPFLMIDRVLEIEPQGDFTQVGSEAKVGTRVVSQKAISSNEPFFQGHFRRHWS